MRAPVGSMLLPVTRISLARVGLVGLLAACSAPPIDWDEPVPAAPRSQGTYSAVDPAAAAGAGGCIKSVRIAKDSSDGAYYAVWWAARPDSTADLVASRSTNGLKWDVPVRVDTLDAGRVGCRRLPPSIAADAGNVHVAYSMAAREGPGIFASHSMDRGTMFHSPVAVVYGERIGLTSIAARGNLVAVAYEDPNTTPRRVGVAVSKTMAHLFQARELVSPDNGEAAAPAVSLRGDTVTVEWTQLSRAEGTARRMMRRGRIR